jgi:hypothetical protein
MKYLGKSCRIWWFLDVLRGYLWIYGQVKCFCEFHSEVHFNPALTSDIMRATMMIVRRTLTGNEKIEDIPKVAEE